MQPGLSQRPSRPKRRTTLTSWLSQDSSVRTLHFMQLDLRRHCFTALRESCELNMMLSYDHGPHFNVRERISGKMCRVFVDCTTQKFAQFKFRK